MNKIEISKRKHESYKRAEIFAREFRYQISTPLGNCVNTKLLGDYLVSWMAITGNIKYERPANRRL